MSSMISPADFGRRLHPFLQELSEGLHECLGPIEDANSVAPDEAATEAIERLRVLYNTVALLSEMTA